MKAGIHKILFIAVLCLLLSTGCGSEEEHAKNIETGETETREEKDSQEGLLRETEQLAENYRTVYEKAKEENSLDSKNTIEEIITILGEEGYCAVDSENQINMTHAEEAQLFCEKASDEEKAEILLFIVTDQGGFVRYDLHCMEGNMTVQRSSLTWDKGGNPHAEAVDSYVAEEWKYTEKGYLFLELERPSGFDGPSGHTAIRIKPLAEELRRWNEQYILPIGYKSNNLFTTNWSAESYGELCFYDVYEPFYKMKMGEAKQFDAEVGTKEYAIPEQEFESVIQTFLPVDTEVLRMEQGYDAEIGCYLYRQRGLHDLGENPDTPYPEVVGGTENGDGTVTLTVDAVWKKKNTDKAFTHQVKIRPAEERKEDMPQGSFVYLSNELLPFEGSQIPAYIPRLTDEEWQKYYGENK
ncbi:DUF6070 family protein [Faecalicatena acetigenes]|uniref:DUF6070 family protein n=1 Tax=Faecalicatena acetigenes TaxID=2981790 RepID=A0ABT2TD98_9FIRM|nr:MULTISPECIES: DUF6070 family protein [Lachnospiraceae]MCU6747966.1 DUF6070 family protein [Faecalicatena acetigenes]SCI18837.1 Uncharacterised protein [uncultured Clostridium sp.]